MPANTVTTVYGQAPSYWTQKTITSKEPKIIGLAFPVGNVSGNYFRFASDIELIKNQLQQILLTERGERVMLPNFGCNLRRYIFAPLDEITFDAIKEEVSWSIVQYTKGIKLMKIGVFSIDSSIGPEGLNGLKVILTLKLDYSNIIFDIEMDIE